MGENNFNMLFGIAVVFLVAAMFSFPLGGLTQSVMFDTPSEATIEYVGTESSNESIPQTNFQTMDSDEQRLVKDAINQGSATGEVRSLYMGYTLIGDTPIDGEHTGFRSALLYTWIQTQHGISVDSTQQMFSVYEGIEGETYTFSVENVEYAGDRFEIIHFIKNAFFGLSALCFIIFFILGAGSMYVGAKE